MRKVLLSSIGGLCVGLFLSFLIWDYEASSYEVNNQAGIDRTVSEWDFDFLFNASLLVIAAAVVIYLVWTYVDKKKHQKFADDFTRNHQR